ncbi:hypothetical protein BwSF12_32480 [Bradyrhizobium ottawaense]|jgi:hypothetical protein|nr:hypothetical protein [Bradyrhizobium sp. CCBAU 21359]BBO11205.1 hypothetical protein TM102_26750 [Bradyrhizobium sp. TM102]GMO33218.1 hypothetical protein BwSF12_32480 [Bradyrhizobium ottawaense]GMO81863.1 hypothetical protein BwSF19_35030 [Bradyrhizobium ottawaense]
MGHLNSLLAVGIQELMTQYSIVLHLPCEFGVVGALWAENAAVDMAPQTEEARRSATAIEADKPFIDLAS